MLGQSLVAGLIVMLLALVLSETFPGRRGPPVAAVVTTAQWYAASPAP